MAAKLMTTSETLFESESCGRCGGCGQYSYCQMYGTTCFGCNGQGVKLTKRGFAASNYYRDLFMVPVESIVPGNTVKDSAGRRFAVTAIVAGSIYMKSVDSAGSEQNLSAYASMPIERENGTMTVLSEVKPGDVVIYGKIRRTVTAMIHNLRVQGDKYSIDVAPDGMVFKCRPADEVAALKAKALAYQATLTKAGKVSKKLAAA